MPKILNTYKFENKFNESHRFHSCFWNLKKYKNNSLLSCKQNYSFLLKYWKIKWVHYWVHPQRSLSLSFDIWKIITYLHVSGSEYNLTWPAYNASKSSKQTVFPTKLFISSLLKKFCPFVTFKHCNFVIIKKTKASH